jgi:uncharacterized protein
MPTPTPLDVLILALAAVAMPLLSVATGRKMARTPRSEWHLVRRYWILAARGALFSLLLLLDWRWAARPWSALGLDVPVGIPGRVGLVAAAALACFYIHNLRIRIRKSPEERIASLRRRMEGAHILPQKRGEFPPFFVLATVGGIFEELLYRGFLIWLLTPVAGLWGAVLLSSALFGLGHAYQGWSGIARTGLIGPAFGSAYALTHSLWWLILVHVMANLYGGLLARWVARQAPAPAQ